MAVQAPGVVVDCIIAECMGRYGKVWEGMGRYGKVWEGMGRYEQIINSLSNSLIR